MVQLFDTIVIFIQEEFHRWIATLNVLHRLRDYKQNSNVVWQVALLIHGKRVKFVTWIQTPRSEREFSSSSLCLSVFCSDSGHQWMNFTRNRSWRIIMHCHPWCALSSECRDNQTAWVKRQNMKHAQRGGIALNFTCIVHIAQIENHAACRVARIQNEP